MNTIIIMLLLWIAPALVLAPLLAWAVFRKVSDAEPGSAELIMQPAQASASNQAIQAEAQQYPEQSRNSNQTEQAPARQSAAFDVANNSHAITYS